MDMNAHIIETFGPYFEKHGKTIYGSRSSLNSSPLYTNLSLHIATDPQILQLVAEADRTTTITNLLFGAVHFLLLSGVQAVDGRGGVEPRPYHQPHHTQADFYPGLTPDPRPLAEAYPSFRSFCLEYADEIRHLVTTRRVQTNEVERCSGLLPAFSLLGRKLAGQPLALVEIGASAGLHLLWDRYDYDYGPAGRAGDPTSSVKIVTTPQGALYPPLPARLPSIAYRIGLDLHPIDVRDEEATRWLKALIWPEHRDRIQQLEAVLHMARFEPPTVVEGNAAEVLPELLAQVPQDAALCLYHSYTLNQMPRAVREQILQHIADFSHQRDLYRLSQEGWSLQGKPELELYAYHKGEAQKTLLAYCESHGRWIEWQHVEQSA
jgi:hypothetical protein